jgi:uncharacterized protein (TIGR02646 family)
MHGVDRGEEPVRLAAVRKKYTPRWVRHYRHGEGKKKPGDTKWREFQPHLSRVFFQLCAYCEELCKGEVEHFRPKSRFPERVYEWSNWVLACHTCNQAKLEKWPSGGYVDPCAKTAAARPEEYFRFDTKTGEILPKRGLSPTRRKKAQRMIDDLGLKKYHHLKRRVKWLRAVENVLAGDNPKDPGHKNFIRFVTSRETELSSITRQYMHERGYSFNDDG